MQVYRGVEQLPELRGSAVTIGSFDGVHLGHCKVLDLLCACAREIGGDSVVVTFAPHPQRVLHPERPFFTINTLEENLALLEKRGIDIVLVLSFTTALAAVDYQAFLQDYVFNALHAKVLVMGPNHTIGHHKDGNHQAIIDYCEAHQVQVKPIPEYMLQTMGVHSATIREAIRREDWTTVNHLLGYTYKKSITVEKQQIAYI